MRRCSLLILLATLALLIAACAQPARQTDKPQPAAPASPEETAIADAAAHAAALRDALNQSPQPIDGPRIAWIDPSQGKLTKPQPPKPAPVEIKPAPEATAPQPSPPPPAAKSPNVDEAAALVLDHIRKSDLTPIAKAAAAVTLSNALQLTNANCNDRPAVDALRSYERDMIERYRHVVAALRDKVAAGTMLDRETILTELDAMFEHAPIRIRSLKMCQRVRGYGVFDELDATAMLAGREHRMIAYVELEDYGSLPGAGPDGQYEVKLTQEIELYNEADGLAVWRQEPVAIVDHCRNKRRDFFVVQLIKLPPRLSVGKYLLKVRVTDQHGGSVDETTLPIAVVADSAMVQGR